MNILRKLRIAVGLIFLVGITLLFLDFTGTLHQWIGWMAKVQFLPAILAVNAGVVIGLIALTLLFGRLYCSIICPLGVFQDAIARANRKRNKYSSSPALNIWRYSILVLFVVALLAGVNSFVALLAPYSAYGRIVSNIFAPIYLWGNNLLAFLSERVESYMFFETEVWIRSISTLVVAIVTLIVIGVLSWRGGRTYCNTICPVGTVLGFLSRFSLFKHRIDLDKCNSCGLCARKCKAACIDPKKHSIDHSRCVCCFDCIDSCNKKAIYYGMAKKNNEQQEETTVKQEETDNDRRQMLTVAGGMMLASALKAQETKMDGGLAFIEDKKIPKRQTPIAPPGASSIRHFNQHCTACQLCITVCPNQVLRPSSSLESFMQPEVSYERGYCRPECTKCSEVCPTSAISLIAKEDKSSTQVGHAVWIPDNCVVLTDGVNCGNCARHCPVGAITMIEQSPDDLNERLIPMVDVERCIGCGACENLCPSRPFSAIYVEGHRVHKFI